MVGTLLNEKLTPSLSENEKRRNSLVQLIRAYFRIDNYHIQFNKVPAPINSLHSARRAQNEADVELNPFQE